MTRDISGSFLIFFLKVSNNCFLSHLNSSVCLTYIQVILLFLLSSSPAHLSRVKNWKFFKNKLKIICLQNQWFLIDRMFNIESKHVDSRGSAGRYTEICVKFTLQPWQVSLSTFRHFPCSITVSYSQS